MTQLRLAHTADVGAVLLDAARALLADVFEDLTDDDWEHCLGGVHALVLDSGEVVGHAAVVQRRLLHGGRALRTGYVEGVAVRGDRRGQGQGAALMGACERVVHGAYDVGALAATDEAVAFYRRRGWQPWRGPLSALTPAGRVPTPEERGGVFVLPGEGGPGARPRLDLDGELTCDWRDGDVW